MAKNLKLTPAEWEIMEAIWKLGGTQSVREVLEFAFPNGEKTYTTVQTFMNILVEKKLLKRKKTGLVNFYTPTRSRDTLVKAEISSLLSRIFAGSKPALASSLLSLENLTLEEIDKIKALLSDKENELRGKPS
jgi:predicted transcriptional regulator